MVPTKYNDAMFKYAKLMPSILNTGSQSPFESLTCLKNSSGVFLMRSDR